MVPTYRHPAPRYRTCPGRLRTPHSVIEHGAMSSAARLSWYALAIVVASLVLGALTSWAQGWLPDQMSSFANSPSGWTILTAVLVAAARPTIAAGAVLGVASFVALVLGYTVASELRGLRYGPLLWSAVGVVAGPFAGAAAAAVVGERQVRAGLGAGALAGVLVADGVYGLITVAETTSPVYWTVCLVLGAALLLGMAVRLRGGLPTAALVATTAAATAVLSAGYAVLNGGL